MNPFDMYLPEKRGKGYFVPEIFRPEITFEEGCLSFPDIRGRVNRSERIVVEGLDKEWRPLGIDDAGILARVILHENDHLDGILFIDRMKRIDRELIRGKIRKLSNKTKNWLALQGDVSSGTSKGKRRHEKAMTA